MNPVRLDPRGPFKRDPLAPHQMRDRQTRTQDVLVLCHLGVARIERDRWSLTIDGMVEHPRMLRFDDLTRYPKTEVASVHQCCGSPLAPFEPTRRLQRQVGWRPACRRAGRLSAKRVRSVHLELRRGFR